MKSGKPAQAATERYPGSPNTRALPEYRSQPIASRCPHDFTTQHSRIDAGNSAPGWADRHTVEPTHVDYEAVGGAPAHQAVAPAPHSDFQSLFMSEFDSIADIIGAHTAQQERVVSPYRDSKNRRVALPRNRRPLE